MAPPNLDIAPTKPTLGPIIKPIANPTRAYVTFLAGNGDYVKGVVGLAKGLRKVRSAYPLVVAVLPDVPEEHRRVLVSQGCIVREIEPVYPPQNQTQFAMAYYVINYSKLRIWETWSHTPQYKIGYCQQCPDKVNWAEDDLGPKPTLYFNAGMFVFEPNLSTYRDMLHTLQITPPTPFAEQDFLNMYFRKIYKPIPLIYNLVLAMLWRHPENVDLDQVKVVHYCANGSKPWRYTGKEENMDRQDIKMLVKKWFEVFEDESLDYKPEIELQPRLEPFRAALSEAGVLHYITAPSAA
ncbi:hypothetical protein KSS87_002648 [Heliosperma pusillum]|nr:hypothetical protein KSS87_002648 [Heliosperma pusillum]